MRAAHHFSMQEKGCPRSTLNRRAFVSGTVATLAACTTKPDEAAMPVMAADVATKETKEMPTRRLGRTGAVVSIVGIGGYHMGSPSEAEGIRIVRAAVDRGVTFLDNCWDYHAGESESRMGKALKDGYRDKVFLMTKLDGRTKAAAAAQLDKSLRRLGTDRIDLVQIHEVIRESDPERCFQEGGAIEALIDARRAGKLRFIGFTGHKDPDIHLSMLDLADKHGFRFDTVQMPLNVMDAHYRSFEKKVLPRLVRDEIGVLGMKSMGAGIILESGRVTPTECLHYAMNLPTSVVITGCDNMRVLEQAIAAALSFRPLEPDAVAALLEKTRDVAVNGKYEKFKTSDMFDGTAHHPKWLEGPEI
jgi:predicted aldo/keto reductase-like oxidoreductase